MAIIQLFLILLFAMPQTSQQESPIARYGSIYPHPPEPQHLEEYQLDATFEVKMKNSLWTFTKPAQGRIRMEQARANGGWWIAQVRDTDVNGKIAGLIQLDSEWTKPPKVLFILFDENGKQLAQAQVEAKDKHITGRILLQ